MRFFLALTLVCGLVVGCGAAETSSKPSPFTSPSDGEKDVSSGTPYEAYFPLIDGYLYQYATEGEAGMFIVRVHRESAQTGQFRLSNGTKFFEYRPQGVFLLGGRSGPVAILAGPLAVGTSFRGEHGGTTVIQSTNTAIDVPAGHFQDCIATREERMGSPPAVFRAVYCKGVGLVSLEAQQGPISERASLVSVGPPIAIGPEGVQQVP